MSNTHIISTRSPIRRPITATGWTVLTVLGGILVAGSLVLSSGVLGALTGVLAIGVALGLTTPFALAVCVILIGIMDPASVFPLGLAGGGLFCLALAGFEGLDNPLWGLAILSITTAVVGGITGLVWTVWPPWLAGLAVLIVVTTLGYGVHRYERVMLGLVTDDRTETEAER